MRKQKRLIGRMVQIMLRVSPDVDQQLQAIADREERSVASVARQAVSEFLERRKRSGK